MPQNYPIDADPRMTGEVDDCEISDEDRAKDVDINDLID